MRLWPSFLSFRRRNRALPVAVPAGFEAIDWRSAPVVGLEDGVSGPVPASLGVPDPAAERRTPLGQPAVSRGEGEKRIGYDLWKVWDRAFSAGAAVLLGVPRGEHAVVASGPSPQASPASQDAGSEHGEGLSEARASGARAVPMRRDDGGDASPGLLGPAASRVAVPALPSGSSPGMLATPEVARLLRVLSEPPGA